MTYEAIRHLIPYVFIGILVLTLVLSLTLTSKAVKVDPSTYTATTPFCYVVIAYLKGKKGFGKQYVVTATTDMDQALLDAKMEEYRTGNNYLCEVLAYRGKSVEYIKRI